MGISMAHNQSLAKSSSFPMKSRNRLACDLFSTYTTHSGIVRDVTDTHCLAQHGSTHCRVFQTFKHLFVSNRIKNEVKN